MLKRGRSLSMSRRKRASPHPAPRIAETGSPLRESVDLRLLRHGVSLGRSPELMALAAAAVKSPRDERSPEQWAEDLARDLARFTD